MLEKIIDYVRRQSDIECHNLIEMLIELNLMKIVFQFYR